MSTSILESFAAEYRRYRVIAERSLGQVSDEALNRVPVPDGNSMAMLVRHLSGNLISRFTDFLTADGEKPWRNREAEFEERAYTRAEVEAMWTEAWTLMDRVLGDLTEDDLARTVHIRGQPWTVHAALARSMSHLAHHVGQLVLLARIEQGQAWRWISIPKGQSEQYNRNPTLERELK
jgi:hypothetical protein